MKYQSYYRKENILICYIPLLAPQLTSCTQMVPLKISPLIQKSSIILMQFITNLYPSYIRISKFFG